MTVHVVGILQSPFLLVLRKGVYRYVGAVLVYCSAAVGPGRMNTEALLQCRGKVQPGSVSVAGGCGRDHGALG